MMPMETENGQRRQIIAINSDNDLDQPPDPKYLQQLKGSFPG